MRLLGLFNSASGFAQTYDGSEPAYRQFMKAAIAYEEAGGEPPKVDELLDTAIGAINNVNREEDFLERLAKGGAQIFHHGSVFVRPDPDGEGIKNGEGEFTPPVHEPRLREVVMALQAKGVYFDDLVIDVGRVSNMQMREWPYVIVTIPRLNAQIAVADQKGEALFAARPALAYMNWALFEKKMAGQEGTVFENVTRTVHSGAWEERLMKALFGEEPDVGPKVNLSGYIKAHRKLRYPLTEEMVVAMAQLHRLNDPERLWPGSRSGEIDPAIVLAVTGDPNWQEENWKKIDVAGHKQARGLTRPISQILYAHNCHYDFTEIMIAQMARLTRERDPDKKWPTWESGEIAPDILEAVTGDKHWRKETWKGIQEAGDRGQRGLERSLSQILKAQGCHYDLSEHMVVQMARLTRLRDTLKKWPAQAAGQIPLDIVRHVTGDPHWQIETWAGLDAAGARKGRGLTRTLAQILDAACPERGKVQGPVCAP